MSTTVLILVTLGTAIILGLAGYAWHLWSKLRVFKEEQNEANRAAEEKIKEFQKELIHDVRFIARAVLEEQCEITEGVIRIHFLISKLDPEVWLNESLSTTRQFYAATLDMPILDAYKALSKQEQFTLDNERFRLEKEHKDAIYKEFKWLVAFDFPAVKLVH